MQQIKIYMKLMLITLSLITFVSCKKPEGPGGKATVKGRVFATDWDNTQRYVLSRTYSPDERVYIIYGKGNTVGNDVRTGPDGSFEFKFLTKGHYKVYVNSLDTTSHLKGNDTYYSIIQEFDITGTSQTKTLPDFKIAK